MNITPQNIPPQFGMMAAAPGTGKTAAAQAPRFGSQDELTVREKKDLEARQAKAAAWVQDNLDKVYGGSVTLADVLQAVSDLRDSYLARAEAYANSGAKRLNIFAKPTFLIKPKDIQGKFAPEQKAAVSAALQDLGVSKGVVDKVFTNDYTRLPIPLTTVKDILAEKAQAEAAEAEQVPAHILERQAALAKAAAAEPEAETDAPPAELVDPPQAEAPQADAADAPVTENETPASLKDTASELLGELADTGKAKAKEALEDAKTKGKEQGKKAISWLKGKTAEKLKSKDAPEASAPDNAAKPEDEAP